MKCERCQIDPDTIPEEYRTPEDEVKPRAAMTAYSWDGKGKDPNRDIFLCEMCWLEYYDSWAGLWGGHYEAGL